MTLLMLLGITIYLFIQLWGLSTIKEDIQEDLKEVYKENTQERTL